MPQKGGQAFGSVKSLWRYSVKSMAGQEMDASEVTARGVLGTGPTVSQPRTGPGAKTKAGTLRSAEPESKSTQDSLVGFWLTRQMGRTPKAIPTRRRDARHIRARR
jgi:hypothetical protein